MWCFLQDVFPAFFARVLALRVPERQAKLAQHEQTAYLLFMIHAFQSLEDEMVRSQVSSHTGCGCGLGWSGVGRYETGRIVRNPSYSSHN